MMRSKNPINFRDKFSFLDEKTSNEPHIFEVLSEILTYQTHSLPSGDNQLATIETLKNSRNITIPFTTTRERTIEYLTELLIKRYSNFVKPIISFNFDVDEGSKKLNIHEDVEYTIMIGNAEYEQIASIRDKKSLENLGNLLKKYRIFNLSKLLKKSKNKSALSRIIKLDLGKKIFVFKNYSIDDNNLEKIEDYCFYEDNYNAVKESIKLVKLKEIISYYSDSVKRELKKFGILNAEFSHYKDTKLDYLFNILINDLSTILSDKDLIEVKNIHSLITCLNRVDKILDPIQTLSKDILKFIREHKFCEASDIINVTTDLTAELLKKWASVDTVKENKILVFYDDNEGTYFIDGTKYFEMISELNQLIQYQPEEMSNMSHYEKLKKESRMEILYKTGVKLFSSDQKSQSILGINSEKMDALKKIIEEYGNYKNNLVVKEDLKETYREQKRRKSFFQLVIQFVKSIFRRRKVKTEKAHTDTTSSRKELSRETRQVYKKTINRNSPIIPLSDLIELTPANDALIDVIIDELREHNIKIVVPIYNARSILFPKKSQNLLISDIEYLLVSTDITKSPDEIRRFIDSLLGFKIKGEVLTGKGLVVIEKYLMTLYRQKRARLYKK